MAERVSITTPVGRIVAGSLYKGNDKNFDGQPLTYKTGANAGQPRVNFFFALAIPKGVEKHWAETPWGSKIWQVGNTAFPQAAQRPDFAWKIDDGDSVIPNKRNRRPIDQEGYKGHWVLKLSGGFSPKVYRQDSGGYVQVTEENYVKPGYFVEVALTVDGNGVQNNPGVYLNHQMVCFRAYGPEISFGPDVNEAGFGHSPLPAGASLTPPASTVPMPAAAPASAPPPITPMAITPRPEFLQVPMPGVPAAASTVPIVIPSVPPASPSKQMTAKAAGASREAFLAGGWTDEQLIANGYMTA